MTEYRYTSGGDGLRVDATHLAAWHSDGRGITVPLPDTARGRADMARAVLGGDELTATTTDRPDLDAIAAREQAASKEVARLCKGGRWEMRVPARDDADSDMVISRSLSDIDVLTAEVRRLTAERDQARAERDKLREALAGLLGDPDECRERYTTSALRRMAGLDPA